MNELITIETLPVIKYHLEQLSKEIKEKVDKANALIVNDETVKEVKQVRANLTKEFNELESQRKAVKQAIMSKYDEFEEIYKENVSNLYKQADLELKTKIDDVENQLKQEKQEELELFAKEYIKVNNLENIMSFDDIPLNITLSASMKSLKEETKRFIESVANDIELIKLEEYSDEILLEYKKTFDFTKSKLDVLTRKKQLEELKTRQLEQEEIDRLNKLVVEKVEEIVAPKEIIDDEDIITVTFKITDTKENIIKVREYMKKEGIKYE